MPQLFPNTGESRDDYVKRCTPIILEDGTASNQEQAVAMCNAMWGAAQPTSEYIDYVVGEFRGDFPAIDHGERVDIKALTAGDDAPFFITLPIAHVDKVSDNGLTYDKELVATIEREATSKGGIMGHLKPEDRNTSFPISAVHWVGVKRQGERLWGKGYIPPGEVREEVRLRKARGDGIATSIYGRHKGREALGNNTYRLRGFRLESLDLAPPDRAALPLGGDFAITAQMKSDSEEDTTMDRDKIIAELTVNDIPSALREKLEAGWKAGQGHQNQVTELTQQLDDGKTVIAELQQQVQVYKDAEFDGVLDGHISELMDWKVEGEEPLKKFNAFKRMFRVQVVSELGDGRTDAKIKEAVSTTWDDNKLLAETMRDALAGPPAFIRGKQRDSNSRKVDDTPENRAQARSRVGI